MRSSSVVASASALLVSLLATPAAAQLHTECNPLEEDCKPNPALATAHTFNFNATPPSGVFKTEAGTVDYKSETGAAFTIPKKGFSPTIKSNFYFFWGKTEVIMKPAKGRGIVSSIVWSSDVLDEVDWEFLGGNNSVAETNYFGKGRQDFHNAIYHPLEGVTDDYHNYTTVWTKEKLDWYIDDQHVRTLLPKDANNTDNYPQTPMMLSLGIWAGGDPDSPKGTIEWAQGETDYNEAPFTMYVKSCRVEDYSKGKEYVYGDRSGSWESIKIVEPEANSTAVENINRPPPEPEKSLSEKWDDLPQGAKSGVYVGAVAVGAGAFIALLVYYLRQRKRGQREAAAAAAEAEKERLELEQFRKEGRDPDALAYEGAEYNAAAMGKGPNVDTYQMPSDSRSNSLTSNHDVPVSQNAWDPTSAAPLLTSPTGAAPSHSFSTPDAQMRSGPSADGFEPTRTGSPGALDRSYSAGPYSGNDFGSPQQGGRR